MNDDKQTPRGDAERAQEIIKVTKTLAKYDAEIMDAMDAMDSDQLKQKVLAAQQNLLVSERRRKLDVDLEEAEARRAELKKPYDDTKKFQGAIVAYGMIALEGRGTPLGNADEDAEETELAP